jgi:hypothetical protein
MGGEAGETATLMTLLVSLSEQPTRDNAKTSSTAMCLITNTFYTSGQD